MKRQYLSIGLIMAAFMSSCQDQSIEYINEETVPQTPQEVTFNITINAPTESAPTTRSMKKGWVEGDRLLLWFDEQPTYDLNCKPNYILEFTKGNDGNHFFWKPVLNTTLATDQAPKNSTGSVWAFFEGENNGAPFQYRSMSVPNIDPYYDPHVINAIPMLAYAWNNEYTFDASTGDITADLHWFNRADYIAEAEKVDYMVWTLPETSGAKNFFGVGFTNFQIVITGLNKLENGKYGDYALKCDNFNNITQPYPGGLSISTALDKYTLSIQNEQGPAFYFKHDSQNYAVFYFTLMDLKDPNNPEFYTYTVTNQPWDSRYDYFTGIVIPFEKFKKAKFHNYHEYVDLGLKNAGGNPIYLAATNVNAFNLLDTYSFYAWGNQEQTNGAGTPENYSPANPVQDPATFNWGGKWRTPTKDEFQQLINNCNWTLYHNSPDTNTEYFWKVSNKDDPTKFVYLPIGYCNGYDETSEYKITNLSTEINYWTMSPDGDQNAYSLEITPTTKEIKSIQRFLGRPIRAVYDPSLTTSN